MNDCVLLLDEFGTYKNTLITIRNEENYFLLNITSHRMIFIVMCMTNMKCFLMTLCAGRCPMTFMAPCHASQVSTQFCFSVLPDQNDSRAPPPCPVRSPLG